MTGGHAVYKIILGAWPNFSQLWMSTAGRLNRKKTADDVYLLSCRCRRHGNTWV